ncbi:tRNA (adenosine(37)-N6)-threonylcarbamoyltransferase complex ATPase subunit type 1 TsaE [Candidatus Phytoplasma phoenicium]|uniref:tRNA threonylcarbamoyladenosine biosynthesis protein TsaE n=1 Tax=Candidatus Phytoplasma phoenicium TaxID=198422 RepID=A0A0L0MKI7_9MOLU|nr:tRNA (adenosine(37)-N6)-threonylcarbamoyltransferase complex ATPase subunit type 1 TsaE [Candidatus Phytoplasma phoenicium]KND62524.1 putative P-loop nucleoside triphosphate hydrolase [Candidatus Phytoplasma phoenicium]
MKMCTEYKTKIVYKKITKNPTATQKAGFYLSQLIHEQQYSLLKKHIILIEGKVGSGKTVFTKGIAKQLKVKTHVNSPTFFLLKTYQGKIIKLHHLDLYSILTSKNPPSLFSTVEELLEMVDIGDIVVAESIEKGALFFPYWDFKVCLEIVNHKTRNIIIEQKNV